MTPLAWIILALFAVAALVILVRVVNLLARDFARFSDDTADSLSEEDNHDR